jgi:hypothetical protein
MHCHSYGGMEHSAVLISIGDNDDCAVMQGLVVAQVWLLLSYFDPYHKKDILCALIESLTINSLLHSMHEHVTFF